MSSHSVAPQAVVNYMSGCAELTTTVQGQALICFQSQVQMMQMSRSTLTLSPSTRTDCTSTYAWRHCSALGHKHSDQKLEPELLNLIIGSRLHIHSFLAQRVCLKKSSFQPP